MMKVPIDLELSQIGEGILDLLHEYYDRDEAIVKCSPEALLDRIAIKFQDQATYNAAFDYLNQLPIKDVSTPNIVKDIQEYKKHLRLRELQTCLVAGSEEEIQRHIDQYAAAKQACDDLDKTTGDEQIFRNISIRSIVEKHFTEAGTIKLWPKQLNDLCGGGARPGHHILIFARPEIGKTLFAQNLVAGFLSQGLKVLYVGNEDPASDIIIRQVARLSKMTKQGILDDPDRAAELAHDKGFDNLVVVSLAPGNFRQIRGLVEEEKPQVVVLDQLRNIDVDDDIRVQALEKATTEARNLGKRYNLLVVSITQAGQSAEGKAILGRDDVDGSKTGVPAQVDLMVGIGADKIQEKTDYRTISLPKNKLSGNHGNFTFSIDRSIGLVNSS